MNKKPGTSKDAAAKLVKSIRRKTRPGIAKLFGRYYRVKLIL